MRGTKMRVSQRRISPRKSYQNSTKLKCHHSTYVLSIYMKRKSNYINAYFKISWATKPVLDLRGTKIRVFQRRFSPQKSYQNSTKLKCHHSTYVFSKYMRRKSNYINAYFKISWATKPV